MTFKGTLVVHGSLPSSTFRLVGILKTKKSDETDPSLVCETHVKTSSVQKMECVEGVWYATTVNSRYQLEFRDDDIIGFIKNRHPKQFIDDSGSSP
jgi:hypothetical protein